MGAADILWNDVNPKTVEDIYRRAKWLQNENRYLAADYGMRFVQARDYKTMQVLEKCAEVLVKMDEAQSGETQRQASTAYAFKFPATVVSFFREGYRVASDGKPEAAFSFLYAAAGEFAGHSIP